MTPDDREPGDDDVLARYRRASTADGARPSAATRAAILAEAQRIAAAQAPPEVLKPFDTRTPAANQGRWKLAAFGTLGVAVFAALLMLPVAHPPPPSSPTAAALEHGNAVVADTAAPAAPPREIDLSPPPAATAAPRARAVQPSAPRDLVAAAPRAQSPALNLDKSADAAREEISVTAARKAMREPRYYTSNGADLRQPVVAAPLLQAVAAGDLAQVTRLLNQGAALDGSDDAGRGPLFLAVMQRRADLVRLLLAHGADPAVADRSGRTPLDWARQEHFDDMVQLLSPSLATH